MRITAAIDTFIAEVKRILADDGATERGMQCIANAMQPLLRATMDAPLEDEPAGNIHEAPEAAARRRAPLYHDDTGLTLVRARFGPESLTPIHSHGSWGVIGVYRGRDRYQIWRRVDGGDGPGDAQVELVEERILVPGDTVILPPPPQDIHAQQGMDGRPVFEYVLLGRNAMALPRLYFDIEAGTATQVIPAGAR